MCSYVRLELLEGVAAYYSGDRGLARARLKASQERWQQLQVSDERLVELLSMGFDTQEVTIRASNPEMCGQQHWWQQQPAQGTS